MSVILFVDMLGSRKKWESGGVEEATSAFVHFHRMVMASVKAEPPDSVISGGVETDGALLICQSTISALNIAKRLFRWSFDNARNPNAPRLWLRGSLVPNNDNNEYRKESVLAKPFGHMRAFTYTKSALDAISIEKAGFKGMRLLVRSEAIDAETKRQLKIAFDEYSLVPFRTFRHIGYPKAVQGQLQDYLWMATNDEQEWHDLSLHMTSRLRHSARDQEEFAQAASTQVVFHEYAAIQQSIKSRVKRRKANNAN